MAQNFLNIGLYIERIALDCENENCNARFLLRKIVYGIYTIPRKLPKILCFKSYLSHCVTNVIAMYTRPLSMCQHFSVWKVSFFVREFSQGSQIVASELSLDVIATCRATKLRLIWCFSPLASTCKDLGWRN